MCLRSGRSARLDRRRRRQSGLARAPRRDLRRLCLGSDRARRPPDVAAALRRVQIGSDPWLCHGVRLGAVRARRDLPVRRLPRRDRDDGWARLYGRRLRRAHDRRLARRRPRLRTRPPCRARPDNAVRNGLPAARRGQESVVSAAPVAGENAQRPLASYAALMGAFLGSFGGLIVAVAARGGLPERMSPYDLALAGTAGHKLSRLIATDEVTAPLRAPFVVV